MAKGKSRYNGGNPNTQLGFEAELFKAADKLRGNMEPSDNWVEEARKHCRANASQFGEKA